MRAILFLINFKFNPYALSPLFTVILSLILLYLLVSKYFQTIATRWFALLLFSIVVFGTAEVFGWFSTSPLNAAFWQEIEINALYVIGPIILAFTLTYVNKSKLLSNFWVKCALFGPMLISIILSQFSDYIIDHHLNRYTPLYGGWYRENGPLYPLVVIALYLYFFYSILLLINYLKTITDHNKRRQIQIFISAFISPLILYPITSILLPAIFQKKIIPDGVFSTTSLVILTAYGIFKYRLFYINPITILPNILQNMTEALIVLNSDCQIEFINNSTNVILGYEENYLIGKSIKILLDSKWTPFQNEILKPIYEAKKIASAQLNLIAKSGEIIPVNFSTSAYKDEGGKIVGLVCVATDIRKLRELIDITAERNKLAIILESISDGVLSLDLAGSIIMANSAALRMLDLTFEEIRERNLDDILTIFDPEGGKRISTSDLLPKEELEADTTIVKKYDVKIVTLRGQQIFVDLASLAIKEGKKINLGAIITLHDVSEEEKLGQMERDLVIMSAHELRSPITLIRGYLSLLLDDSNLISNKTTRSYLDESFQASTKMMVITNNLLNVYEIDRGVIKLKMNKVNWIRLVEKTVAEYKKIAKIANINLFFIKPKTVVPKIKVDKYRIQKVLENLLLNAIEYSGEGKEVKVWIDLSERELITHVQDNGRGIPEEILPYLFVKFSPLRAKIKDEPKGIGLGLYIAKSIIDMHKGMIWAESEIGKGSTFSFSLPLNQNKEPNELIN